MAWTVCKIIRSDQTSSAQVTVSDGFEVRGVACIAVDSEKGWAELEEFRANGDLAAYIVTSGGFGSDEEVAQDLAEASDWRTIYPVA